MYKCTLKNHTNTHFTHILQSFLWQKSNSTADKPTNIYTTRDTRADWPPNKEPTSQPNKPTNNQFKPPTITNKNATMCNHLFSFILFTTVLIYRKNFLPFIGSF